jgi:hypothetical protein
VIKDWSKQVQDVAYDSTANEILKGIFCSESTYDKIRNMTIMETKEEAEVRVKKQKRVLRLPLLLREMVQKGG